MAQGEEYARFEKLLRKRGTRKRGNAAIERQILERYQDDCAVLVLDSSGFTRITQQHGIVHFLALFVSMHDAVKAIIQEHDAIAQWGVADNVFAVFPTARRAVQCGLAIQDRLRKSNAPRTPSDRLDVCIGIGSGRMLRIGTENIFGDEMNLAAKLGEDIAVAREVLVTEAVHRAVKDGVKGVEFEPRSTRLAGVEFRHYLVRPVGRVRWSPTSGTSRSPGSRPAASESAD